VKGSETANRSMSSPLSNKPYPFILLPSQFSIFSSMLFLL